ncbi:E3 ubiquitin-protein ligase RHF2A [Euphorbia lathyris]|uniref:E3 ubiquitin-protein ligase RHF2A n=1 Tax=Euphorbia lathyris TaxID=212925 RepID=UPI0033136C6E
MEGMEEISKPDAHLTSAAAFVEGGIQDACDDACSICLEPFSDTDPSTVTSCKHEFHLQCVLEWCQRSSQCPMCWQSISMKDPTSQELLEAVEHERNIRFNQSRNATIFRHPTLGDFELQHLPVGLNDAELEERIIQHLAAAAAMGRRHIVRREGQRNRSSAQGRQQFLVFSSHPNAPLAGPISTSSTQRTEDETIAATTVSSPSSLPTNVQEDSIQPSAPQSSGFQSDQATASRSSIHTSSQNETFSQNRSPIQSSSNSQDRAGPSELQTFSESIKSKLNAVSMRYKESISKSTRGWKERFFSRNTSMEDLGSEVRKEVNAGIATVSRMMERLETRDNNRTDTSSASNSVEASSTVEPDNQQVREAAGGGGNYISNMNANMQTSCAASSGSN